MRKEQTGGQDSETKELGSVHSNFKMSPLPGDKKDIRLATQQLSLREQNISEREPPIQAQFQVGIVGYHEKRQKSDLEQEIEASIHDTLKKPNMTEAYNTKYSASKPTRQHRI